MERQTPIPNIPLDGSPELSVNKTPAGTENIATLREVWIWNCKGLLSDEQDQTQHYHHFSEPDLTVFIWPDSLLLEMWQASLSPPRVHGDSLHGDRKKRKYGVSAKTLELSTKRVGRTIHPSMHWRNTVCSGPVQLALADKPGSQSKTPNSLHYQ